MKNKNLSLIIIFVLMGLPAWSQSKPKAKQHRIVFHLASADTLVYRALTRQLNNVLDYWPTATLEVVAHSRGIAFMRKDQSVFEPEIQALKAKGVVFAVCENTMKQQKLIKDQILNQAVFVPVGLAEIITRQEEGWSYIKAGF